MGILVYVFNSEGFNFMNCMNKKFQIDKCSSPNTSPMELFSPTRSKEITLGMEYQEMIASWENCMDVNRSNGDWIHFGLKGHRPSLLALQFVDCHLKEGVN